MGALARVEAEKINRIIRFVRGCRVLLDWELASLYGVEVRALNQAVRRHIVVFEAIQELMEPPAEAPRTPFGLRKSR